MSDQSCVFCTVDPNHTFYRSDLIVGLWDQFPVSRGHALLVPRRHIATWFDATSEERSELLNAIDVARDVISASHRPDGFNIGINVGAAAGQTVFHLHVHVIPRYNGDVHDPRGGVRHVIPSKANYLAHQTSSKAGAIPHGRALIAGAADDPLYPHLIAHLDAAMGLDIAVAFAMASGVDRVFSHLQDLLARGGRLRLLTGDYLGVTDPRALLRLLDLPGMKDLRVFESAGQSFHPKSYIIHHSDGTGVAFVGSSNLSETALFSGIEWNFRTVSSRDARGFQDVQQGFDRLFSHAKTRPLTLDWVEAYSARRPVVPAQVVEVPPEPLPPPPEPHLIQREALAALESTRRAGNGAGLVVLATGLGKTWLSAFDSSRPEYQRVLFVAHRDEILSQAMSTFRRVRPLARLGRYTGEERTVDAEVIFASIQTLGRQRHLETFARDAFDYVVVDEFHHASAPTYRRLISHFTPKFLLGLTATPERTDGGDLLALCQENLVYRCDLVRGIEQGLLCPFSYVGVPDEVDYANIPWRSNRFDEEALTNAVATQTRAENALNQWRKHGGRRTLAFCCSQRHADYMRNFFRKQDVRAAAVHAGPSSDPRATSLEQLEAGELDVLFAVDMFNEGLDVPTIDTVLMLRPTESQILWLQQFGRGLRCAPGKERLKVVDYIGNHRVFLIKPQTLLGLERGDQVLAAALRELQQGEWKLPPGCEVTYELRAVEILQSLLRLRQGTETVRTYYLDFRERNGARPLAVEAFHDGYNPRTLRSDHGSWLGFVRSMGDLSGAQQKAFSTAERLLTDLEVTKMTKSFKTVVLLAMLNRDCLPGSISINDLAREVRTIATRSSTLASDFEVALDNEAALMAYLEENPIAAWAGGRDTEGSPHFSYQDGIFTSSLAVAGELREPLQGLLRELLDWRIAEYLNRPGIRTASVESFAANVSHSQGRPILFLADRIKHPALPNGWTTVLVGQEELRANFVKVAVNVVTKPGSDSNVLPELLRSWFGPDAGKPGTSFRVGFNFTDKGWVMAPIESSKPAGPQPWKPYMREAIPGLFGLQFSTAIWNVGFVATPGHLFLLVTLDKGDLQDDHQYQDHFVTPELFEWQSQNRTKRDSRHGRLIQQHQQEGVDVHLFVRRAKRVNGESAPFVYCGEVDFVSCKGDAPMTVRWQLRAPVPNQLREQFKVPNSQK